jgi:hypothetical protein
VEQPAKSPEKHNVRKSGISKQTNEEKMDSHFKDSILYSREYKKVSLAN